LRSDAAGVDVPHRAVTRDRPSRRGRGTRAGDLADAREGAGVEATFAVAVANPLALSTPPSGADCRVAAIGVRRRPRVVVAGPRKFTGAGAADDVGQSKASLER